MPTDRITLPLAFMLLYGCAHGPSSISPHDPMSVGEKIVREGCPLGAAVTEQKIANRHEPTVVDTIKTISCDGTKLSIYMGSLASRPSGLPIYLEIRKPRRDLPSYMDVGESVRGLVHVLGQPFKQIDGSIIYLIGEADDSVTFSILEGRIVSIRWDWYLD